MYVGIVHTAPAAVAAAAAAAAAAAEEVVLWDNGVYPAQQTTRITTPRDSWCPRTMASPYHGVPVPWCPRTMVSPYHGAVSCQPAKKGLQEGENR